ncbi:NUDIX hydrolase [Corynebacterium sp. TAE3-ERU12]|uniref:NUDIX domain-containing protein n=1 Tax=Corynebacterium sp. TAE3-ERU12 TaxID=2849491 RepID=UPI001C46372B|nr:NUDIX hydrolase [Corynebacterium sp. TAE3-ERU12]MBV7295523.1 NUDIX hydrolase [Corynebacterium sp. TAE3-ERU12]
MAETSHTPGQHVFDVVDSTILVESPILAFRRDRVRMPGGRIANREIVEHFGAVAVVAVDAQNRVAMVRQWRQAAGERLWELPAGLLDVADEQPLAAARRELAEEAGLASAQWSTLVDIWTSPGFAQEAVRILLAEDVHEVQRPEAPDDEEADLVLDWFELDQAIDMVLSGEIRNGIAVAGILAAVQVLQHGRPRRAADPDFTIRPRALADRRKQQLGGGDLKRVPNPDAADGGAGAVME